MDIILPIIILFLIVGSKLLGMYLLALFMNKRE